jgi:hypothetical protein
MKSRWYEGKLLGRIPILLTYGLTDLSVPIELDERGDIVSRSGLGRIEAGTVLDPGSFTSGDGGGEITLFSLIPSFQAGGEGIWKRSCPLSSDRFAI